MAYTHTWQKGLVCHVPNPKHTTKNWQPDGRWSAIIVCRVPLLAHGKGGALPCAFLGTRQTCHFAVCNMVDTHQIFAQNFNSTFPNIFFYTYTIIAVPCQVFVLFNIFSHFISLNKFFTNKANLNCKCFE